LVDDINFSNFQCIDSDEFKLLSKKVGKSRRRKDAHYVQYILGKYNKVPNKGNLPPLSEENIENLDAIKAVLQLLRRSNRIKLAPVRILKEEGKDGNSYHCKSRPRRRSTLKKKEKTPAIIQEIRRSKRLSQLGLKRNSDEMKKSAFVQIINSGTKMQKLDEDNSPSLSPAKLPIEDRKDEVLTDNECNSLKIPSLKDFNLSKISIEDIPRPIFEDRLSESSLSNKMAHYNIPSNIMDKVSDGLNDEEIQNWEKMYSRRNNSRQDQQYFKRLSAASLFWHNHKMSKQQSKEPNLPADIKFTKELSKNSDDKNSLRKQINNMNPDQLGFIRSISHLSNFANFDLDVNKNNTSSAIKLETKQESTLRTDNLRNMATTGLNDLSNDMRHDVLSLENNDDFIHETERLRGLSQLSNNGDFSFNYGNRKYSKRNSLISNLSLQVKPDAKED
jgi:Asp-tRNA(Asn)/Glu-tRNA(Gln) amidotransferase C subunit